MSVSVVNFRADHARIYQTGFAGSILTELGFEGPKMSKIKSKISLHLQTKRAFHKWMQM